MNTPKQPNRTALEALSDAHWQYQKAMTTCLAETTSSLDELSQLAQIGSEKTDTLHAKFDAMLRQFEVISTQTIERAENTWILQLTELYAVLQSAAIDSEAFPQITSQLEKVEHRLADESITWIAPTTGDVLDKAHHKPLKTETTPDPSLHGKIAQVYAHGLLRDEVMLTPARVSLFKYQAPAVEPPSSPESPSST